MVKKTPNHKLNQYEKGEVNWTHAPDMQTIEERLVIRDEEGKLEEYTPYSTATFIATDTGAVFDGTGESWTKANRRFESIETKNLNNILYASQFSGSGLASKVENALNSLKEQGGSGQVVIPPKDNGNAWTWDKDITIDPTKYTGLEILIKGGVRIEYPGSGIAIHVDTTWEDRDGNGFSLLGGNWIATGNPTGFIRVDDTFRSYIVPGTVEFFENARGDTEGEAFGIQMRNVDGWTENYFIGDPQTVIAADYGIQLLGARVSRDEGENSQHGGVINRCASIIGNKRAVDVRANVQYGGIYQSTLRAGADNADMLYLNPPEFLGPQDTNFGRMEGYTLLNVKFEDANDLKSNDTAVRLGPRYDGFYGPIGIGCKFGLQDNIATAHPSARNPYFVNLTTRRSLVIEEWVNNIEKPIYDFSLPLLSNTGIGFVSTPDVLSFDSEINLANAFEGFPEAPRDRLMAFHDGSGSITLADGTSTSAAGLYIYDASSNGWRSIVQYN